MPVDVYFPKSSGSVVSWDTNNYPPGLSSSDYMCLICNNKNGDFRFLVDEVLLSEGSINSPEPFDLDDVLHYFTYRKTNGVVTSVATSVSHIFTA